MLVSCILLISFRAVDGDSTAADTGTATIKVTVTTGANVAPAFGQTSYTANVASGSQAGLNSFIHFLSLMNGSPI